MLLTAAKAPGSRDTEAPSSPDSRNTPLCRAPRLSVSMFFHVKPRAAR